MLGGFIKEKREALGYSRNKLAELTGISHTELRRIEIGDRTHPSATHLNKIADALHLPHSVLLVKAGYMAPGDVKVSEISLPDNFTEKQQEAVAKLIHGLARSSEWQDTDIDKLNEHIEMFFNYAKSQRDSK